MEIDWEKVRDRYVAGGVSYRGLAKEFGVADSTVKARGKKEGWVEQRAQYVRQLQQKWIIRQRKVCSRPSVYLSIPLSSAAVPH